jgi:hypothetical protein
LAESRSAGHFSGTSGRSGETDLNVVSFKRNINMSAKKVREEGLDKFYTVPSIVKECISNLELFYAWSFWDLVIEPSAGSGSFLVQIPTAKKIGLDISPEHKDIVEQDFLLYSPPRSVDKILFIGNPPFGRVCSLAIKFFNHAAERATVIAFIVPRTFRRVSIQNKLNSLFHLVFDNELPPKPCPFSPPMMAKCCFQIWEESK